MKKDILRILVAISILGLVLALFWLKFLYNDNKSKQVIANEIARLAVPAGCTESRRAYTSGDLGVSSNWSVVYSCNTTSKRAYDELTSRLDELGYQAEQDSSKEGQSVFYWFTYSSSRFTAEYQFNGLNGEAFSLEQKDQLDSSDVYEIRLDMTRSR